MANRARGEAAARDPADGCYPLRLPLDHTATTVAVGLVTQCLLDPEGQGYCWGSDMMGSNGTLAHEPAFVPVAEPAASDEEP